MLNFFAKLRSERYLSAWVILVSDLVVSALSSFLSMFLLWAFIGGKSLFAPQHEWWVSLSLLYAGVFFYFFRTYRIIIRHSSLRDLGRIVMAVIGKDVLLSVSLFALPFFTLSLRQILALVLLDFLLTISFLILLRVVMVLVYDMAKRSVRKAHYKKRVLVYGVDSKSVALAMRFKDSTHYVLQGFLSPGHRMKNSSVSGFHVYYFDTAEDVQYLCEKYDIGAVLFATQEAVKEEKNRLMSHLSKTKIKALIAPPLDEVKEGVIMKQAVREVKIEDLLGRPEIQISIQEIVENFRGKEVLVTGAAGSIGSELCRQLAGFGVKELILFDNAETPLHNLRLEFEERYPGLKFVPVIGDVRQLPRLDFVFRKYRPQVVFHAAAYKHVPLMEENPCEAVLVNVVGSRNVADKCLEYDVEKMVMVSTDKAVNPTNIMGCTKRLAEIYVQSLGLAIEKGEKQGRTRYVTTRFGNVLGSNGSVIPRFSAQIAKGGPVTVTHPEITRFFMTIPEACRLVMEAATMGDNNRIFVFDMGESVKIRHLAQRMIELAGFVPDKDIKIEYTGLRPGEKLYEEVLSNAENTLPTSHKRIHVAKVREYAYEDVLVIADELGRLSREVEIPDMVRLMKRTVPEFISKNSVYEQYDVKE